MLRQLLNSFFIWLVIVGSVFAEGWQDFPLSGNTNVYGWYEINYSIASQLFYAVDERCEAVGVSRLSIVETNHCWAGFSNQVVTNVSMGVTNIFTNTWNFYTNIITTNQVGSFDYVYGDPQGIHTNTACPDLTQKFMSALDGKIFELIPYFVSTNMMDTNGTYDAWFATTNASGNHPFDWPKESKAGLFYRLGIGSVTNLTTNEWGFVTGGTAQFTHEPFPYFITASDLDERYKVLNALRHADRPYSSYIGPAAGLGGSEWIFSGYGSGSTWAAAKSAAEANLQHTTYYMYNHGRLGSTGYRSTDNSTYYANCYCYQRQNTCANLSTNLAKEVWFYLRTDRLSEAQSRSVFTNWGMNLRDDLHTHFETTPASYEASVTGSVYGITSWIYDWCDEPPLRPTSPVWDYYTTFGNEQGGFVQRTLVNWAVTNGFRFR